MQLKLRKRNKGFTLIETLVAISILSLSILATFTAVQGGLKVSSVSKNQMIAFFLTQEVMEYIKNIRDQNVLATLGTTSTVNWLTGIAASGDACASNQVCEIDAPAKTVTACSANNPVNCRVLTINSTTGVWGYGAGTSSGFKRAVQIQVLAGNTDEARVTVTISWTGTGGLAKTFTVTESIFNRK